MSKLLLVLQSFGVAYAIFFLFRVNIKFTFFLYLDSLEHDKFSTEHFRSGIIIKRILLT